MPGPCWTCGVVGELRCSRCLQAIYCSPACQRAAWKSHRVICIAAATASVEVASVDDPRMNAGGAARMTHEGAEVIARACPPIPSREELESQVLWPVMGYSVGGSASMPLVGIDPADKVGAITMQLLSLCNMVQMRVHSTGITDARTFKTALASAKERGAMGALLKAGADPCLPMLTAMVRPHPLLATIEDATLPWAARKHALVEYTTDPACRSPCTSPLVALVRACDAEAVRVLLSEARPGVVTPERLSAVHASVAGPSGELGLRLCGLLHYAMMCPFNDVRAALVMSLLKAGARGSAWAMSRPAPRKPFFFSDLANAVVSSVHQGCPVDLAAAMLRQAVDRGASLNTTDSQGVPPLSLLVNQGLFASSPDEVERTAEFIGVMASLGADPDAPEAMPQVPRRPVDQLQGRHGLRLAKALATAGASFAPALYAMQHGSGSCGCTGHRFPAATPAAGGGPGTMLRSYLHEAAARGDDALLRFAIDAAGAPPDPLLPAAQQLDTPLGWAVRAGRPDTVRLLLSLGADPALSAAVRGLGPAGPDTEHYAAVAWEGKKAPAGAYAAALAMASAAASSAKDGGRGS